MESSQFSEIFAAAVADRGLSLDRIRSRLESMGVGVSQATLSYWQTGRSLPGRARSMKTVAALEYILDLPQGALTDHLPQQRRRAPSTWPDIVPERELVNRVISDEGISTDALNKEEIWDLVEFNAEVTGALQHTHMMLRAAHDDAHSFPIIFEQDEPGDQCGWIEGHAGCHVRNLIEIPGTGVTIAHMELDTTLSAGERIAVEYSTSWQGVGPELCIERVVPQLLRMLAIEVRFVADHVPSDIRARTRLTGDDDTGVDLGAPLQLTEEIYQQIWIDPPEALHGLHWHIDS